MRKQYFNLIEIALAIAIIAVGMSSVLVLFPAGLNAVNSAAADNSAPDAVHSRARYTTSVARAFAAGIKAFYTHALKCFAPEYTNRRR